MTKKKIDPEVQKKEIMETECKEILERKVLGILPLNPTRIFAIDERVQWGNMQETDRKSVV